MPFSDEKLSDITYSMAKTFEGNILVFVVSLGEIHFSNYKVLILISKKKIYAYFETAFLKAPEATFVWCP